MYYTGYNETMRTSEDFEIHVKITMTVILKWQKDMLQFNQLTR